ncbi:hypothetical protein [Bosea sp. (in: a-proteobacteria)]|uniref:hypothetical protein n=1 Tax=Bosea sp. (in: a-proteobacteria) TaxID=1871050 RepID=UPI00261242A4|nr:hypothetical protein [Bosea sp. (in: a-proteobacteria)]MCO5092080.1 hypothetical protein [Bosea sp. (in: a-proteobacteria)]
MKNPVSPSQIATRLRQISQDAETARKAGDIAALQRALARETDLRRRVYGKS